MSAIAGLATQEPGSLRAESLEVLAQAMRHLGPDGTRMVIAPRVAMVYALLATAADSCHELFDGGSVLLSWDGRLDNIASLRRELRVPGGRPEHRVAQVVVAAYERWGTELAYHLIGDYSLALWDAEACRLLLARDAFGTRPLYYTDHSGGIAWASSLGALCALTDRLPEVNDSFVAGFLIAEAEHSDTPYRGIHSVPPGHQLTWESGSHRVRRFWDVTAAPARRFASDVEYEEAFLELFEEAVRCRLPSQGSVCAELSGGLDSSSIVCVADRMLADGRLGANVITISYIFDEASLSDERSFIQVVEEARGRRGRYVREEDHPILAVLPGDSALDFPTVEHCFAARHIEVGRIMEEVGARVLLRGLGGDQVLWGDPRVPLEVADKLHGREFGAALRSLGSWSRALGRPYIELLWRAGIVPLLPRSMRAYLGAGAKLPEWLTQGFVRAESIRDRAIGPRVVERLPSRREQSTMILDQVASISWPYWLPHGAIEVAYPFLHRPLVEYCVAIPHSQLLRPGETRSLLRRSMDGILPPRIAARRSKAGPAQAIYAAVRRRWKELDALLKDARVGERGYVDVGKLAAELQRCRNGLLVDIPKLLRVVSLELWLRSRERSSGRSKRADESRATRVRTAPRAGPT